jgi:hypothetical protein
LRIRFGGRFEPENFIEENAIEEKEFIIRSIFNNDYCPLLKCFSINTYGKQRWKTAIPSLISTTKPTKIKHLSMDLCTFSDFIKLLPALKNVTSFHTDYYLHFDNESNQYLQNMAIAIPLLSKCIRMQLKLSDDMMFEHVEYILKQAPNLKDLFLWGWYHLLNAKKLENLLLVQCPNLVKLELVCTGFSWDDNLDQAVDNFEQDRKTSAFWLERNITIDDEDRSDQFYRDDITIQFNIKKVTFIQMLTDFYAFFKISVKTTNRIEWDGQMIFVQHISFYKQIFFLSEFSFGCFSFFIVTLFLRISLLLFLLQVHFCFLFFYVIGIWINIIIALPYRIHLSAAKYDVKRRVVSHIQDIGDAGEVPCH